MRAAALALAAALVASCSDSSDSAPAAAPTPTPTSQAAAPPADAGAATEAASPEESHADLVERGRRVYVTNCIACHNPDPSLAGGLGPEVSGSSRELLLARVIHGNYPDGYQPKRDSRVMIALPHLENDIDALTAYLAE